MIHIHPFPARMAPEIALAKLSNLNPGQKILDPMVGSGMVLSTAARQGIQSIGVDIDPLSVLISSVASTKLESKHAYNGLNLLLDTIKRDDNEFQIIPWIDSDEETKKFIDFWFFSKQTVQLRKLSYHLVVKPIPVSQNVLNLLITCVSRLIITKEPMASLARDTAHSRPHRVLLENNFDVFASLPDSLKHVLKALDSAKILTNATTYHGDARHLDFIDKDSIDAILTSPPYLNAIDYMRGHKFSLVWFGYTISKLRNIRLGSIGSEKAIEKELEIKFSEILNDDIFPKTDHRMAMIIRRYFVDLYFQLVECFRVLKPNGIASFVIGNSELKGQYIPNSEFLIKAATSAGFELISEETREIPNNRRYLPITGNNIKSLSKRMRTEHIISFIKRI